MLSRYQMLQVSVPLSRKTLWVKSVVASSLTDVIVRPLLLKPAVPSSRLFAAVNVMLLVVWGVAEMLCDVIVVCTCATAAWRTTGHGNQILAAIAITTNATNSRFMRPTYTQTSS